MFKKVLIANRGEIALRIIRACKELNIKTVAVYSEADKNSLHVRHADEAYCIGPAQVAQSYLNIPTIISAALLSGADGIHPGYGFLAENVNFVEICESHNIKFIGPNRKAIALMGDKAQARRTIRKAGVPVLVGAEKVENEDEAYRIVNKCGYPVILKAVAGGGGKGMRVVHDKKDLKRSFVTASAEALSAFGDGRIYIEKYLIEPRHIEFQILADKYGNVIHLGERDCSVQRRNQKLIEESPSPIMNKGLRTKMGACAVKCARASGYDSAGTVEFLLDQKTRKFYFMEMNTRIQVEHPVTEMITGIDLVKEQIKIASGEKLKIKQEDVQYNGHVIECRINAEDGTDGFAPSSGRIINFLPPGGPSVRIDTHIHTGAEIMPFYDSLIAKVIVHGRNRDDAINVMYRSLNEFVIEGVKTTIPFHKKILNNAFFREGNIHTTFVEKEMTKK
ncbi:MAG: acetyl-CoA carboxylase biotin carboxylase subunit [Armatimonadota bacterium]